MNARYVIRFEQADLVCFLVNEPDYTEIRRIVCACEGELGEHLCLEQVDLLQDLAVEHAGRLLAWAWSVDDRDPRVCWADIQENLPLAPLV